jgi:hypothetical protein
VRASSSIAIAEGTSTCQLQVPHTRVPARFSRARLFPTGAVFKDGKQFLVIVPEYRASSSPITVVVNWLAALQK